MSKDEESKRGRPPLGRTRMITVGVRLEPEERDLLTAMAKSEGDSVCGFLRNLVRRELAQACAAKGPVCSCGLAH